MSTARRCLVLLVPCLLAACQPRARPLDVAAGGVAHDGTRRFECEGGHRVAVRAGGAHVELADGRRILLPPGGTGAWRGEALSFVITADRGSLSQDEVGAFLCMRAV